MDLGEAASALGVYYQTAYAWMRQGILPARQAGRGYADGDGDVAMAAQRVSRVRLRALVTEQGGELAPDRLQQA